MKGIAKQINLPFIFAGIFIVSVGTALPELVFGVKAVLLKHKEMVLGNYMGTVVFNSAFILGLVGLISPFKIQNLASYKVTIIFVLISSLFFTVFALTKNKISRNEGIILILIYGAFLASQALTWLYSFRIMW